MTLQRFVLTFDRDAVTVRALYRTTSGASPGTKARTREVRELARAGLVQALEVLDAGDVADLGTSGYEVREDVLGLSTGSSDTRKLVKESAANNG